MLGSRFSSAAQQRSNFWLLGSLFQVIVFGATIFYVGWASQSDMFIDGMTVRYGLFKVCGLQSADHYQAPDDCYEYGSSSIPPQFHRIVDLSDILYCGTCDERRKAVAAMLTLAFIVSLIMLAISVLRRLRLRDGGSMSGDPGAHIGKLSVFTGLLSLIGFAVWANMVTHFYNGKNGWPEVGTYPTSPKLSYGPCFALAIFMFLFCWLVPIQGRN